MATQHLHSHENTFYGWQQYPGCHGIAIPPRHGGNIFRIGMTQAETTVFSGIINLRIIDFAIDGVCALCPFPPNG